MAATNPIIVKQPNYVIYDQKEREAFLSQIGTFTVPEREVFHKLAKMWSPRISYDHMVSTIGAESATAKTDLNNVLEKLKHQKIGLLQTKINEGNRIPEFILLCEQNDSSFYAALLDESLLDLVADISKPLPSYSTFEELNYPIPPQLAKEIDFKNLAILYLNKTETQSSLLKLTLAEGTKLLIPSNSIKRYITIAIAKLQNYFNNANFAAMMAQMRSASLMELKKQLSSKDSSFWLELAVFIESQKKEILSQRKINADQQLFTLCEFLKGFLSAQQDEVRARKEKEQEKLADMKILAERVKTSLSMVMSEQEFAQALVALKPKYPETFNEFKDEFSKAFFEPPQGKNLPILAKLGSILIHQDNINAWFETYITKISRDLLAQYVEAMSFFIKHTQEPGFEFLYSSSALEEDIIERVRKINQALFEAFDRPNLIAEGIIHGSRKGKEPKSSEEFKSLLALYFYTDRIRFRSPSTIFSINIQDIFKLAFSRLSILRQIIMKISGRYESILKKFDGFIPDQDVYTQTKAGKKEAAKANRENNEVAEPSRRKRKADENPKSSAKPEKKILDKKYSDNERNEAWTQFSKTLKK